MFRKKGALLPKQYKLATISELINNTIKHEACGKTVDEALSRLTELCRCYNRPEPELVPGYDDLYHCGTIVVPYMFTVKTRYNTVWFTRKNDMIITSVHFPYL